jgi:hypothetical protein
MKVFPVAQRVGFKRVEVFLSAVGTVVAKGAPSAFWTMCKKPIADRVGTPQ